MAVIRITEYRNRDTVSLLRDALERAIKGEVQGVCLAMKLGPTSHGIALSGEYFDDPTDVLAVAARLTFEVNMLLREPAS
jgi:hypothetical protein